MIVRDVRLDEKDANNILVAWILFVFNSVP